jgi:hypothetical protein
MAIQWADFGVSAALALALIILAFIMVMRRR